MGSTLQPNEIIYPIVGQSIPIVYNAYAQWSGIAQQAFATAQQLATQVANIPLSPVAFTANFSPSLALTPFPTMAPPPTPNTTGLVLPPTPSAPTFIDVPIVPPPAYVQQILGTVQATLLAVLNGGNLIPDAVARQLRDRAYTETFTEEQRAVEQAYDEFAARGFEEPPGMLNRRVTEARADALRKRQMASRDVYVQEQMTAIENLKFAITSGIQCEQVSVEVYRAQLAAIVQSEQVQIDAARLKVTEYQAAVTQYDAQLRGLIAQLDAQTKIFDEEVRVYEANVQAANVAGQYDERRFQLNLAQQQAVVTTEMKRQDQQFEQMKYLTSVMLQIKTALADVSARLASAAMSAVNIGASLSSSSSEQLDYTQHVSWAGQLTDAGSGT